MSLDAESRLIELRGAGLSYSQIAEQLAAEGYETAHGGEWQTSTITQVLDRNGVEQPPLGVPPDIGAWALRRRLDGATLGEIAADLNARGVASPLRRRWHQSSVSVLLRRAERTSFA